MSLGNLLIDIIQASFVLWSLYNKQDHSRVNILNLGYVIRSNKPNLKHTFTCMCMYVLIIMLL